MRTSLNKYLVAAGVLTLCCAACAQTSGQSRDWNPLLGEDSAPDYLSNSAYYYQPKSVKQLPDNVVEMWIKETANYPIIDTSSNHVGLDSATTAMTDSIHREVRSEMAARLLALFRESKIKARRQSGLSTEGFDDLSYELSLYQFDCKNDRMRILEFVDYNETGQVIDRFGSNTPDVQWSRVVPESKGQDWLVAACGAGKRVKAQH